MTAKPLTKNVFLIQTILRALSRKFRDIASVNFEFYVYSKHDKTILLRKIKNVQKTISIHDAKSTINAICFGTKNNSHNDM